VRLDAVLLQARFLAEFLGVVVEDLFDRDHQFLALFVFDDPELAVFDQPAGRAHPVQRFVRTVVGVHRHRTVGLDEQQPGGHRQVGGEPAGVVDLAPRDHKTHPRRVGQGR
jgi:hypothetical protein